MQPRASTTRSPAIPVTAGLALLALAAFAVMSILSQDNDIRAAVEADLRSQLTASAASWEESTLAELRDIVARFEPRDADFTTVQNTIRERYPIVDSVYIWNMIASPPSSDVTSKAILVFPQARPGEDALLEEHPCVADARAAGFGSPTIVETAQAEARAWRTNCRNAPLSVQVYAALQAAEGLRQVGRHSEGIRALTVPGLSDPVPVRGAPELGVSSYLRALRRVARAELLLALGNETDAADLAFATSVSLATLDAPDLERTVFTFARAREILERTGRAQDVERLAQLEAQSNQRLAAWTEVQQSIERLGRTRQSMAARLVVDPYGDDPYLLYYSQLPDERRGVAVLVKHNRLIDSIYRSASQRFPDGVFLQDERERMVRGGGTAALTVDLPRTLQRVRVGLSTAYVDSRMRPLLGQKVIPIAITLICVALGLGALFSLTMTNQEHRRLLSRQREFTQRVTHELKTPLAGMKVMAENLALGAWKTDAQRDAMAERIVDEADRLTARVNEILAFSRTRAISTKERFDIEEPLLEAITVWGPRYEMGDVKLTADFDATDPVMGDPLALRDAVSCLLDNAFKYRREDLKSEVVVNLRQIERSIEVEVIDNGMGVPIEYRRDIFKRFVRVEGPNRGKAGGHGLGLAQVNDIIRQHRGSIRCEDGMDGGSRFIIRLPVAG